MTEFAITPSKMLLDTYILYQKGPAECPREHAILNVDFPYVRSLSLCRDSCTPMNQIAHFPAYSRSMSTTKIILIISSSTKILYLEDILLKCLPKKIKH